jgi:hypothetical protein
LNHYQGQGKERGIDRFLNNLNGKLDRLRLWPEGDDGNGHDHSKDYDRLARRRYEDCREQWFWHESSWCMRGLHGYDGQGCNQFTGCVPECVYADGRLDLSELERIKDRILRREQEHADAKGTKTETGDYMHDKTRLE